MTRLRRRALMAVMLGWAFALAPGAEARDKPPASMTLDGKTLRLNGSAVQTWWFWDVYTIALYLETPTTSVQEVLDSEQLKCLHLRLLRDVPAKKLKGALTDGFRKNNDNTAPMEERLERLLAAIPDGHENDDILVRYAPGKGIRIEQPGGASVEIPGKDFAAAMFRVWLGDSKGLAKIKKGLLTPPGT